MQETSKAPRPLLEVCCGTIGSVVAAAQGGADRVELCSGLDEGGLTPSLGFLRASLSVDAVRTHVLIRHRGGDFLYSERELQLMLDDIRVARDAGAHGVVVGALTADGNLDMAALEAMREAAGAMSLTFHRAFDMCRNPEKVLEQLISLGFHRILTSGQASTAEAGIPLLRRLVVQAAGRISLMPGCGVSPANAGRIISETGAREIHASARTWVKSKMKWRHDGVSMGEAGVDEYAFRESSALVVRQIRASIDEF